MKKTNLINWILIYVLECICISSLASVSCSTSAPVKYTFDEHQASSFNQIYNDKEILKQENEVRDNDKNPVLKHEGNDEFVHDNDILKNADDKIKDNIYILNDMDSLLQYNDSYVAFNEHEEQKRKNNDKVKNKPNISLKNEINTPNKIDSLSQFQNGGVLFNEDEKKIREINDTSKCRLNVSLNNDNNTLHEVDSLSNVNEIVLTEDDKQTREISDTTKCQINILLNNDNNTLNEVDALSHVNEIVLTEYDEQRREISDTAKCELNKSLNHDNNTINEADSLSYENGIVLTQNDEQTREICDKAKCQQNISFNNDNNTLYEADSLSYNNEIVLNENEEQTREINEKANCELNISLNNDNIEVNPLSNDNDIVFNNDEQTNDINDKTKYNQITSIVHVAGYDNEIFKLKREIQERGEGKEVLVYFYFYKDLIYHNLGYIYTDTKALKKVLLKYTHFFCLDNKSLKRTWCFNNVNVKPLDKILNSKVSDVLQVNIEDKDITQKEKEPAIKAYYPNKTTNDSYEFILTKENDTRHIDLDMYKLTPKDEGDVDITSSDKKIKLIYVNPEYYNQENIERVTKEVLSAVEDENKDAYIVFAPRKIDNTADLDNVIKFANATDYSYDTLVPTDLKTVEPYLNYGSIEKQVPTAEKNKNASEYMVEGHIDGDEYIQIIPTFLEVPLENLISKFTLPKSVQNIPEKVVDNDDVLSNETVSDENDTSLTTDTTNKPEPSHEKTENKIIATYPTHISIDTNKLQENDVLIKTIHPDSQNHVPVTIKEVHALLERPKYIVEDYSGKTLTTKNINKDKVRQQNYLNYHPYTVHKRKENNVQDKHLNIPATTAPCFVSKAPNYVRPYLVPRPPDKYQENDSNVNLKLLDNLPPTNEQIINEATSTEYDQERKQNLKTQTHILPLNIKLIRHFPKPNLYFNPTFKENKAYEFPTHEKIKPDQIFDWNISRIPSQICMKKLPKAIPSCSLSPFGLHFQDDNNLISQANYNIKPIVPKESIVNLENNIYPNILHENNFIEENNTSIQTENNIYSLTSPDKIDDIKNIDYPIYNLDNSTNNKSNIEPFVLKNNKTLELSQKPEEKEVAVVEENAFEDNSDVKQYKDDGANKYLPSSSFKEMRLKNYVYQNKIKPLVTLEDYLKKSNIKTTPSTINIRRKPDFSSKSGYYMTSPYSKVPAIPIPTSRVISPESTVPKNVIQKADLAVATNFSASVPTLPSETLITSTMKAPKKYISEPSLKYQPQLDNPIIQPDLFYSGLNETETIELETDTALSNISKENQAPLTINSVETPNISHGTKYSVEPIVVPTSKSHIISVPESAHIKTTFVEDTVNLTPLSDLNSIVPTLPKQLPVTSVTSTSRPHLTESAMKYPQSEYDLQSESSVTEILPMEKIKPVIKPNFIYEPKATTISRDETVMAGILDKNEDLPIIDTVGQPCVCTDFKNLFIPTTKSIPTSYEITSPTDLLQKETSMKDTKIPPSDAPDQSFIATTTAKPQTTKSTTTYQTTDYVLPSTSIDVSSLTKPEPEFVYPILSKHPKSSTVKQLLIKNPLQANLNLIPIQKIFNFNDSNKTTYLYQPRKNKGTITFPQKIVPSESMLFAKPLLSTLTKQFDVNILKKENAISPNFSILPTTSSEDDYKPQEIALPLNFNNSSILFPKTFHVTSLLSLPSLSKSKPCLLTDKILLKTKPTDILQKRLNEKYINSLLNPFQSLSPIAPKPNSLLATPISKQSNTSSPLEIEREINIPRTSVSLDKIISPSYLRKPSSNIKTASASYSTPYQLQSKPFLKLTSQPQSFLPCSKTNSKRPCDIFNLKSVSFPVIDVIPKNLIPSYHMPLERDSKKQITSHPSVSEKGSDLPKAIQDHSFTSVISPSKFNRLQNTSLNYPNNSLSPFSLYLQGSYLPKYSKSEPLPTLPLLYSKLLPQKESPLQDLSKIRLPLKGKISSHYHPIDSIKKSICSNLKSNLISSTYTPKSKSEPLIYQPEKQPKLTTISAPKSPLSLTRKWFPDYFHPIEQNIKPVCSEPKLVSPAAKSVDEHVPCQSWSPRYYYPIDSNRKHIHPYLKSNLLSPTTHISKSEPIFDQSPKPIKSVVSSSPSILKPILLSKQDIQLPHAFKTPSSSYQNFVQSPKIIENKLPYTFKPIVKVAPISLKTKIYPSSYIKPKLSSKTFKHPISNLSNPSATFLRPISSSFLPYLSTENFDVTNFKPSIPSIVEPDTNISPPLTLPTPITSPRKLSLKNFQPPISTFLSNFSPAILSYPMTLTPKLIPTNFRYPISALPTPSALEIGPSYYKPIVSTSPLPKVDSTILKPNTSALPTHSILEHGATYLPPSILSLPNILPLKVGSTSFKPIISTLPLPATLDIGRTNIEPSISTMPFKSTLNVPPKIYKPSTSSFTSFKPNISILPFQRTMKVGPTNLIPHKSTLLLLPTLKVGRKSLKPVNATLHLKPSTEVGSSSLKPSISTTPLQSTFPLQSAMEAGPTSSKPSALTSPLQSSVEAGPSSFKPSKSTLPFQPTMKLSPPSYKNSKFSFPFQPIKKLASTSFKPCILTLPFQPIAEVGPPNFKPSQLSLSFQRTIKVVPTHLKPSISTLPLQATMEAGPTSFKPNISTFSLQPSQSTLSLQPAMNVTPTRFKPIQSALSFQPTIEAGLPTFKPSKSPLSFQRTIILVPINVKPNISTLLLLPTIEAGPASFKPIISTLPFQPTKKVGPPSFKPSKSTLPFQPTMELGSPSFKPSQSPVFFQPTIKVVSTSVKPRISTLPLLPTVKVGSTGFKPSTSTLPIQPTTEVDTPSFKRNKLTLPFQPAMKVPPTSFKPCVSRLPFQPITEVAPPNFKPRQPPLSFQRTIKVVPTNVKPNISTFPFLPTMGAGPTSFKPCISTLTFQPIVEVGPPSFKPSKSALPFQPTMKVVPTNLKPCILTLHPLPTVKISSTGFKPNISTLPLQPTMEIGPPSFTPSQSTLSFQPPIKVVPKILTSISTLPLLPTINISPTSFKASESTLLFQPAMKVAPTSFKPCISKLLFRPNMEIGPPSSKPSQSTLSFQPTIKFAPTNLKPSFSILSLLPTIKVGPANCKPKIATMAFKSTIKVGPTNLKPSISTLPLQPMKTGPISFKPIISSLPYLSTLTVLPKSVKPFISTLPSQPILEVGSASLKPSKSPLPSLHSTKVVPIWFKPNISTIPFQHTMSLGSTSFQLGKSILPFQPTIKVTKTNIKSSIPILSIPPTMKVSPSSFKTNKLTLPFQPTTKVNAATLKPNNSTLFFQRPIKVTSTSLKPSKSILHFQPTIKVAKTIFKPSISIFPLLTPIKIAPTNFKPIVSTLPPPPVMKVGRINFKSTDYTSPTEVEQTNLPPSVLPFSITPTVNISKSIFKPIYTSTKGSMNLLLPNLFVPITSTPKLSLINLEPSIVTLASPFVKKVDLSEFPCSILSLPITSPTKLDSPAVKPTIMPSIENVYSTNFQSPAPILTISPIVEPGLRGSKTPPSILPMLSKTKSTSQAYSPFILNLPHSMTSTLDLTSTLPSVSITPVAEHNVKAEPGLSQPKIVYHLYKRKLIPISGLSNVFYRKPLLGTISKKSSINPKNVYYSVKFKPMLQLQNAVSPNTFDLLIVNRQPYPLKSKEKVILQPKILPATYFNLPVQSNIEHIPTLLRESHKPMHKSLSDFTKLITIPQNTKEINEIKDETLAPIKQNKRLFPYNQDIVTKYPSSKLLSKLYTSKLASTKSKLKSIPILLSIPYHKENVLKLLPYSPKVPIQISNEKTFRLYFAPPRGPTQTNFDTKYSKGSFYNKSTIVDIVESNLKPKPLNYFKDIGDLEYLNFLAPSIGIKRYYLNSFVNVTNAKIIIPINKIGIATYEPNIFGKFNIKTDNPNIDLKAWISKVKILKAIIVIEDDELSAINLLPIVKNNVHYKQDLIEDIVRMYVEKHYGEPYVLKGTYNFYKPFALINVKDNIKDTIFIIWPPFCNCGCQNSGCECCRL